MEPNVITPPPAPSGGETPEKYIRTFANDMEIFQKGGTPGLAPLKSPKPAPIPEERLVDASPPEPAHRIPSKIVSIEPVPPLEPVLPPIEIPVSIPEPVPSPQIETPISIPEPVLPPPPPVDTFKATPLKTYSEDFRQHVKETHASTATILAAEQDAAPRFHEAVEEEPEKDNHNRWYIIAGILLLVVGGIGVAIAYSHYTASFAPVLVASSASTPIFIDSRETVAGTGTVLLQEISQSVGKPLALNTVRLLAFAAASSTSVFGALSTHVPLIVLRDVNAAGSMAGVVNTSSGQSPFFILSVGSYSGTFSGMLSWEPTMLMSLGKLFPLYTIAVASSATTTTISTSSPQVATMTKVVATTTVPSAAIQKEGFRDEVVSNHDVRIYRDAQGRSILLYGYWNQTTLVIARDPAAFAEILARLATSHS